MNTCSFIKLMVQLSWLLTKIRSDLFMSFKKIIKSLLTDGHHGGHHNKHHGYNDHHRGSHHGHYNDYDKHGRRPEYEGNYNRTNAAPQQQQTMIICNSCKTANPEYSRYCSQCGQSLTPNICGKCGHETPAGSKFCLECGTSLR